VWPPLGNTEAGGAAGVSAISLDIVSPSEDVHHRIKPTRSDIPGLHLILGGSTGIFEGAGRLCEMESVTSEVKDRKE
jgi:hypothetical protein